MSDSAEGACSRGQGRWSSCRRRRRSTAATRRVRTAFDGARAAAGHRARGPAAGRLALHELRPARAKSPSRKDVNDLDARLRALRERRAPDGEADQVPRGPGPGQGALRRRAARACRPTARPSPGPAAPSPRAACGRSPPTTASARWPARSMASPSAPTPTPSSSPATPAPATSPPSCRCWPPMSPIRAGGRRRSSG